jgi:hypothetical protein
MTVTAAVTDRDVPLGTATPSGVVPARVRARARARVPATLRNYKIGVVVAAVAEIVAADVRGWWLVADQPGPLARWFAVHRPVRVPADSAVLRIAWHVHTWTVGLLFAALSGALFLAAGALRWLAGHPARAWTFLLIVATSTAVGVAYSHLAH